MFIGIHGYRPHRGSVLLPTVSVVEDNESAIFDDGVNVEKIRVCGNRYGCSRFKLPDLIRVPGVLVTPEVGGRYSQFRGFGENLSSQLIVDAQVRDFFT